MPAKRFRVAFSFAGEKRPFVERVATILADLFGDAAILYDKFHEAEFARRDLGLYLPELYHKESGLLVVIVCADYEKKEWCGLEWFAIHARLKNRHDADVLLARFDHQQVTGVYDTAGFIELDDKSPEQMAILILERLALNEGKSKDHYSRAAARSGHSHLKTATPNNLPRLQPFFGREKELAAIRDALDPESRTWGVLIDGPGGMGKTSLAVRAAYDCPSGQFKRIVFVSVKDRELDDDGVRSVGDFVLPGFIEMLNEVARELGRPEIAKAPDDQRVRLLLDALRPAEALLILDNLESLAKVDRDQLLTFVKRLPQGCKAILTSRRRIGSGSELLILEKLDEVAALETLADLARRNPLLAKTNEAERITLYQQTGGKPLLLRWVAGQLGRGSCRTFTDALHFLGRCPPDNDPLEFVFGDLAGEFTHEETRVLVALTYFTLPVKTRHLVELTGLETTPVQVALRTLANRSLVVPDQEETVFALVPMVADFLRRKRPDVIQETGNRLEKRAYALAIENGYRQYDRFAVLEAAWPTIAAALPLFSTGASSRLQTVLESLKIFLEFSGRWDEWLMLSEGGEAKALADGDLFYAGWRAYDASSVHNLRGQATEVLAWADRAARHWRDGGAGNREQASALRLRGLGHRLAKDYASAATAFQQALEIERRHGRYSTDIVEDLNSLADVEQRFGDLSAAEHSYRESLRIAKEIAFTEGVAEATSKLAVLRLEADDWTGAEALAREALELSEHVGRQESIAADCHTLALALVRQGKAADALPCARRAVEIFARLGSPGLQAALATLGECDSGMLGG